MIYFALFILEIILLFVFSKALINSMAKIIYRLTGNKNFTFHTLAVIFLPGTIIHEIAHMLVAGMMFVPSGEMQILPEIDGDEIRFGSVKIAQSDPIRRFIIGIAPVIFGLALIFTILYFSFSWFNASTPWWQIAIAVLFIFEIANTMFASSKDMEGALILILFVIFIIGIFVAGLYFTNNLTGFIDWILKIDLPLLNNFFQKATLYLLVPLGVDLALVLIGKLLRS